jgi:hypothetical protein
LANRREGGEGNRGSNRRNYEERYGYSRFHVTAPDRSSSLEHSKSHRTACIRPQCLDFEEVAEKDREVD